MLLRETGDQKIFTKQRKIKRKRTVIFVETAEADEPTGIAGAGVGAGVGGGVGR